MKFIYDNFNKRPFKFIYHGVIPRTSRKKWRFEYEEKPIQHQVAAFWQQTIKQYDKGNLPRYNLAPKRPDLVGKKIIWQYWGQGLEHAPELVQLCFTSVDKNAHEYQVIRLTDDNLFDYLTFPEFVAQKRALNPKFRPVFFSDLLRVALIHVYGGVWFDATILLTDKIPQHFSDYDFFMFSRDPNSIQKDWGFKFDAYYFSWHEAFKVNFLSSILFGHAKTELLTILLDLMLYFWQTQDDIPHYFFFQILIQTLKDINRVDYNFPVIDDTLPHLLQGEMNNAFNEARYHFITENSVMHKLSYHKKLKDYTFTGQPTYYHYLKKSFA